MISAHSNHAIFLDYIDRAKLVDSQTVFVFSVGGLDTSQYLLIEIGRICPKLEQVVYSFFFTIFLDVLAHFKHIREKNIFPLENLKTLRIFTQIWSL